MISGYNEVTIKNHRSGDALAALYFNVYNYHNEVMLVSPEYENEKLDIRISDK